MSGTFDGTKRKWRVYLPSNYDKNSPTALVVSTHGWGGSGSQDESSSGLSTASANGGNFIAVFPDGYADNSNFGFWGSWNCVGSTRSPGSAGQICTSSADPSNSYCYKSCNGCAGADGCDWTTCLDDITPSGIGHTSVDGFIPQLYDYMEQNFCIDVTREYHSGMSNGAMFTYQAGASMSSRLAAIVPVAGSFHNGFLQTPTHYLPVMDIHGTSDHTVPANASSSKGAYALSSDGWYYEITGNIASQWAQANGCSSSKLAPYTPAGISSSTISKNQLKCVDHGCDTITCAWKGGHVYFDGATNNGKLVWGFLSQYEKTSHVGGGFTAETAPEVLPESRLLNVHVTVDQEEEIYFPALPDHNDTVYWPRHHHYGNPAKGSCRSDEEVITLSNGKQTGRICAPKKTSSASSSFSAGTSNCTLGGQLRNPRNGCPTDMPHGVHVAYPICLNDASEGAEADSHCMLACGPCRVGGDTHDACSDFATRSCPKDATCITGLTKNMRQGVCVYL